MYAITENVPFVKWKRSRQHSSNSGPNIDNIAPATHSFIVILLIYGIVFSLLLLLLFYTKMYADKSICAIFANLYAQSETNESSRSKR